MSEEEKDGLSVGDRAVNFMLGADFMRCLIMAIPWTVQLWIVQAQRAMAKGERFFPQFPKSLLFYDSGGVAQDILKAYHVHNMHFGASLEQVGSKAELVHSVLVPASQFDYADAILHQHGVALLSPAGSKRGQNVGQPRDYSNRQPRQQAAPRQRAKLGKTYS